MLLVLHLKPSPEKKWKVESHNPIPLTAVACQARIAIPTGLRWAHPRSSVIVNAKSTGEITPLQLA